MGQGRICRRQGKQALLESLSAGPAWKPCGGSGLEGSLGPAVPGPPADTHQLPELTPSWNHLPCLSISLQVGLLLTQKSKWIWTEMNLQSSLNFNKIRI